MVKASKEVLSIGDIMTKRQVNQFSRQGQQKNKNRHTTNGMKILENTANELKL